MILRTLHKWLSILIGVQLIIWVTSGMIISLLDHHLVVGKTTLQASSSNSSLGLVDNLQSLEMLGLDYREPVISVSLERVTNRLIYRITTLTETRTYDAQSGEVFTLTAKQVQALAENSYQGNGQVTRSIYLDQGSEEVPKAGSVWRVEFDDDL